MENTTVLVNATDCADLDRADYTMVLLLYGLSVLILLLLSFTQRRVRLGRNTLWGIPGLVVPADLLFSIRFRLIYVAIFGSMANDLINSAGYIPFPLSVDVLFLDIVFSTIIRPLVMMLLAAVRFFPIFAGVNAPIPIMGHTLGLGFLILTIIEKCLQLSLSFCKGQQSDDLAIGLLLQTIPVLLCFLVVLGWYIYRVVVDIILILRGEGEKVTAVRETEESDYKHHVTYVKDLLKQKTIVERGKLAKLVLRLFYSVFPFQKGFRFPVKVLGALLASLIFTLEACLFVMYYGITLTTLLLRLWDDDTILQFLQALKINDSQAINNKGFCVVKASSIFIPSMPWVAYIFCVLLIIHMLGAIHKHFQRANVGDLSFLPNSRPPPHYRLAASWKYAGYQIAYIVWGWVVYTVLLIIIALVGVIFFCLFPVVDVFYYLFYAVFPLLWTMFVLALQLFLSKYLFLLKDTKVMLITNRRLYHWFAYLLFFYNVFIGILNVLIRVLFSGLFSLLFVFRLDRSVLAQGVERFDAGHKAYAGFISLEYTYNNAVLNLFVELLIKSCKEDRPLSSPTSSDDSCMYVGMETSQLSLINARKTSAGAARKYVCYSKRAYNRWMVAYTLLRNPGLKELTASRLGAKKEVDDSEGTEM